MGNSEKKTTEILGIPLFRLGMEAALHACEERAESGHGSYACFVNVHSLTEATQDSKTREALLQATFSFPDGMPLVWASHLKANPIRERVCGPDFMTALMQTKRGQTFGFIGGLPGQAEKIALRFGILGLSYCPPFRSFSGANALEDWNAFVRLCREKNGIIPRFVWVCLGAPKQELWMQTVSPVATDVSFFGVGAAIDFLAGEKKRAPVWVQKIGLEWGFRLIQEPRRLWRRYLATNVFFLKKLLIDLIRLR